MLILAVDTSGKSISLSICDNQKLIAEMTLQQGYNHSVTQIPLLESILKQCKLTIKEIDLFACTEGPGSFTGIRIGISSIKAIAYACKKPAIGVSSLEALIEPWKQLNDFYICPAIDARRGRIFAGLWQISSDKISILEPKNYLAEDLAQMIKQKIQQKENSNLLITGDGRLVLKEYLSGISAKITSESGNCIRAYDVAQIAWQKYQDGCSGLPQELIPEYLSPSQAERMRDNK